MKNIQSLISSLEKYCIFYLSKYTVTRNKFKSILIRKIWKDFSNKKINYNEKIELKKNIDFLIKKFTKMKVINEEDQISYRINNLINKGTSLKKIYLILKKDKFESPLIEQEITKLKKDEGLDYQLLQTYCKKKSLLIFDKEWKKRDKKYKFKVINKLLNEGFNKDECLNLINNMEQFQ